MEARRVFTIPFSGYLTNKRRQRSFIINIYLCCLKRVQGIKEPRVQVLKNFSMFFT